MLFRIKNLTNDAVGEGFELKQTHNWFQKMWWWSVTIFFLTRDIDLVIERLQARQACAKSVCSLSAVEDSEAL